jgi:7,8-dihydropterin-6-yl-methyl-4-(beta-D-ribofuranosyl)aminobenzene 5'-phosphate synthase
MKIGHWFLALTALGSAALLAAPAMADGEIKIITVMDNETVDPALATEWGFAAAVITPQSSVLFDTGPNGEALLENLQKLGLSPGQFGKVVISHNDEDHTSGLKAFVPANPKALVLVARKPGSAESFVESAGGKSEEAIEPVEVAPGIRTTGAMGGTFSREQALIIDTADGLVVMTGCAHPGIVAVVETVEKLNPGKPVALVMGGFHLFRSLPQDIDRIVDDFKRLKVTKVAPSHCSGEYARKRFQEVYGADYIAGGVGLTLKFDSPVPPS